MVLTSAFRSVFADICEDIGVSNVKEKNFKKSDQKNG
jgi:hypothetical protein